MADNNNKANGFSFVNISVCVDTNPSSSSNGSNYYEMVLVGPLTRVEKKLIGDKHLVSGSIAINGRAQYLNQVLGVGNVLGYELEEDATVWAQVSFWGKMADRIDKYLSNANGSKNPRLLVIGKLTPNTYQGSDGKPKLGLNLSVFNWQALSSSKKDSGGTSWPSVAPATFDAMPQQFGQNNMASTPNAVASWGGTAAPAQAQPKNQPAWGSAPAATPTSAPTQKPSWGNGAAAPAQSQQPGWGGAPSAPAQQPSWGGAAAAPARQPQQPSWGNAPAAPAQQPSWGSASAPVQPGNGFSIDEIGDGEGELPF